MDKMTSSTLLLVGGGAPVSSLSRFQFVCTCPLLLVKAFLGMPRCLERAESHFLLFRQERQTKVDNGPERVCPAEKGEEREELARGRMPRKIPFDPPYLWRASFLFWPVGLFVAFPGTPQSKHSQVCVLTAPLCCVRSFQQREGQAGQQPSKVNTAQNADNKGSCYTVLAPGLRDNRDSHKVLNHHHNRCHQLHNQSFLSAL